jgi:hypothetical protein
LLPDQVTTVAHMRGRLLFKRLAVL